MTRSGFEFKIFELPPQTPIFESRKVGKFLMHQKSPHLVI